jgi:hypothetical protein
LAAFLPVTKCSGFCAGVLIGFSISGYFEDRRPSSNMDPYVVTSMIAETTVLCNSNLSNGSM